MTTTKIDAACASVPFDSPLLVGRVARWVRLNRRNISAMTALQCSLDTKPWPIEVLARVELICIRARSSIGAA